MGGATLTIQWPSDARPANIAAPFDPASGTLALTAPAGTLVRAGAAGKVAAAGEGRVEITSGLFGIIYGNLASVRVEAGQDVAADTVIAEAAGNVTVAVRQSLDPTPFLAQPQPAPTPQPVPTPPAPQKLYVTPTQNGVRVREKPVDGTPLGQVGSGEVLEVLEAPDKAHDKIGLAGQWINVRHVLTGLTGFSAAQFLKVYEGDIPQPIPIPPGSILGLNLDMYNRLGRPAPERLKGVGWIRVKFNVSYNPDNGTYGNTDVNATFNRVKPFIEPYVRAGIKVLMVFTHQLFGEGAGYEWPTMDTNRWNDLIPKYADFARRTAALFAGTGLVHCYQVWNEQDTPPAVARAAVPIPAGDYANMLGQTIRAIRSVDKTTPIITGGHVGGPVVGPAYARAALRAMPADVRPDGIATHPYGRGLKSHPFSIFGPLEEEIRGYAAVMPGRPVWLSEWGVLDRQGDLSVCESVTDYAAGFIDIIRKQFPAQVAAAVWYAWADGMDNGYGLVDSSDRPKAPLYQRFLKL